MEKTMKSLVQKQKSNVHYDSESDVLYFGIRKGIEEEVIEIAGGINAELDDQGKLIGIEILNASKVLRPVAKSLESKLLQVV
jgi:uncharacterized protein YuzE